MWWDPYNLYRDEQFASFWRQHLARGQRRLLFIVGAGFDPRVLGPARSIVDAAPDVERKCIAIDMSEGYGTDDAASTLGEANRVGLAELFPSDALELRRLITTDADGIRDVSRSAAVSFADFAEWIDDYTDVIVDISALPRLVCLTVLNTLLSHLVDTNSATPIGSTSRAH